MTDHIQDIDTHPEEAPSKSQVKRDLKALQDLGEALVPLPESQLRSIPLPEKLLDAVLQAKTIRAHGGLKRQLQYIGKLMREVDAEPIRAFLEQQAQQARTQNQQFHRLESLRDELLTEGDPAVQTYCEKHPEADRQRLRQWIRQAQKEAQQQKPPKAARQLFQYLRELGEA